MTRLRLIALALTSLWLAAAAPATAEAPARRLALVIGEGAYAHAGAAITAVDDARTVAAALQAAGWSVRPVVADAARERLTAEIEAFAGGLKPQDAAFVYFSGLAAKGPSAEAGQGVETYLLPVDADPKAPADLKRAGLALSSLAARLPASAKVLVIDAARPTIPEGAWGAAFGPTEPTAEAFVDAFVVFPAGLERIASDGVFPPVLAEALKPANATTAQVFRRVVKRVTEVSKGAQTPWTAGSARSAELVLHPDGATAPSAAGADQEAYDQALACGTSACLSAAAARIGDRRMKLDLMVRASAATGPDVKSPRRRRAQEPRSTRSRPGG